ncbi:glycoside hydrolase family 27 protein [Sphingomonas sp. BIUV-7]|uniref:Alpha-galactosidase n=1 Tax=Sphingomonas natans TaxID=3063330 RepID=A0ABT8Y3A2_9SPHN|nr:glycoside hydrolase family 27 protein [Sphingomonas sp. BIUV-7]MDO6412786.1 glycoside hydrolase family 27 protein [Sphingomonas sp. BIUV-7]
MTGKAMPIERRSFLGAAALVAGAGASILRAQPSGAMLAPTPPMGWNSWNSFATTITEAQALETAHIMAERLLPFGYDVFTVDIQWYEPDAKSYDYNKNPIPQMDGYGRLLPAPNRFPSSTGGKGFAPLADRVHALGLKFGIHLMRGIPRLAVQKNLPVLGTSVRAADIADTTSICAWNPDMYGVDMTKPGAQAYYDGVFALYASWGVDFIKMDDMSRPYAAHRPEIEAAHRAIGKTARPIVLSLSPGETPVAEGAHVGRYAQMWRISDDFWDEWPLLEAQFARLANWAPYRRPGAWPDADMLPLGRLALGQRDTKFTPAEQQTLMTLWAIARSPLIMGGDLRHLDEPTLALLTNRAVIAVNQASTDNRPLPMPEGARAWSARSENDDSRYLALFNLKHAPAEVSVPVGTLVGARAKVRDLWTGADLGQAGQRVTRMLPAHGAALLRLG